MLESYLHEANAFVSLTYSDEHLPLFRSGDTQNGTLHPKDLQNWLKRFRKFIAPGRIRFYAVGEYGDATWRPHYHAAIFNYPTCARGRTYRRAGSGRPLWQQCCDVCRVVGTTWGLGDVDLGTLETGSAQYLAQYVTKKMTRFDDPRLDGRHPEFCRMSLRPGIGADFMHEIASTMLALDLELGEADVPSALQHGKRKLPLGRYLKRRLRELIGREVDTPESTLAEMAEELRPLYEAAQMAPTPELRRVAFENAIVDASSQKRLNLKTRSKIFGQRKSL